MDDCDCPYAILSVPRNATLGQIKSSYRKLALRHHPDKGGDEAMFKIISAAYEILSDDARRAEHDRLQQEKAATAGADRGASSASASGGRRRSRPAASATSQQQSQSSDSDAFSHPFFQQHHGFGSTSTGSFRTQFTDPFDLFERMFGEEFGVHSSMRRGRGSGGLAGHRSSSSSATRSGTGSRADPFDDPFFANSRSMMGMGRSGMGNGSSMMNEMSQQMDAMQRSVTSKFHSSFGGHHGHAGSVGHHHSSHYGGAATGNGQASFSSSSFSMSSSSGFGGGGFGGGGFGGGRSVSTSTTNRIVNGVQETTTTRTAVHPDGRVERSSSVSTSNGTGMAIGTGNDRHQRYIDQGRR